MFAKVVAIIVAALMAIAAHGPSEKQSVDKPSVPVAAEQIDAHHYANQTPYGDPAGAAVRTPPKGYDLTFLETVGRHGARTLTSSDAEKRSLEVWSSAQRQGALTTIGRGFAGDVAAFQEPERSIGYGNLSAVGKDEWRGIGRRTAEAYGPFLRSATAAGDQVVFSTSPVRRTRESAEAMQQSLDAAVPGLHVAPYVVDAPRLLIPGGESATGSAAIDTIRRSAPVVAASRHLLGRLYSTRFIDSIDDPVGAALDIYLLYCTAPGMAGDSAVTFAPYVETADAKALAYPVDAANFYRFGPGVQGEQSSYERTTPLLRDFFTQLDKRLAGGSTAAVFRLAHGETTMPFAALVGLPGSTEQAPRNGVYSYADNPWRGYVAGRLAGNIEWAVYREAGAGNGVARDSALVTVRYNEQPVRLKASCREAVPFFYRPAELERCLR